MAYPHLAAFLSGWFHQDFDLIAPTWEGVVDDYVQSATREERAALAADIDAFVADHVDDRTLDETFQRTFEPDVIVTAFASTTRAFLDLLRARLRA